MTYSKSKKVFKMIKKRYTLFLFVLISSISIAQNRITLHTPESVGVSSNKLKELNEKLHSFVDKKQLAGIQTAIIRKGKLVHFDTYGYSNIKNDKLLQENSLFRIFSMTKPITSIGLMMLFEEGKFKLEDPLYKYIPEFKNITIYNEKSGSKIAKKPIKIIDLLRHTSGISYGRTRSNHINNLYGNAGLRNSKNLKELVRKLSKLPLSFEPGTNWEYGYSTDICGYLIEVLSGKPLDEYLRETILDPLKMKDTHFQIPKNKIDRFTAGYSFQNGKLVITENENNNRFVNDVTLFYGGGGLVSTTSDYLKFCQMLIDKGTTNSIRLLKSETIDLMTKDHLAEVRKFTPRLRLMPRETGFGLGFSIASKSDSKERGVYGWGGLSGTYFRIDPEKELIYVMMMQLFPYRQLGLRQKFQQLVNHTLL